MTKAMRVGLILHTIAALLLTSCAVDTHPVAAESGVITAINFRPDKAPMPWYFYVQLDNGETRYCLDKVPMKGFKVGDRVRLYYSNDGTDVIFRRK